MCGSTINGPTTVQNGTNAVIIGDDGDDGSPSCAANKLNGPVRLSGNTARVELGANAINGPVTVNYNSGSDFDAPTAGPEIEANHINGPLGCTAQPPTGDQRRPQEHRPWPRDRGVRRLLDPEPDQTKQGGPRRPLGQGRPLSENRIEAELVRDLKRVRGKQGLLFALAEAAIGHPDETVRTALFPVVSEATLRQLVKEAKASEQILQQVGAQDDPRVRQPLPAHAPEAARGASVRCSNSASRPVVDSLTCLAATSTPRPAALLPARRACPVVPDDWRQAVRRRAREGGADPV
ncbi:MAG: hypothetical protein DLM64_00010 [Solirubrobacterales bacterium]|nr:MAG: hypothetical protein DLM64_00010 [Solirubrobacterales bacterium]